MKVGLCALHMSEIREAGETWAQIGAALGVIEQEAQDLHRRNIKE